MSDNLAREAAEKARTKIRQLAAESMGRAFNTTTDDEALLAIVRDAQDAALAAQGERLKRLEEACASANKYLAAMAANGGPKKGWEGIEEWSVVQQQLAEAIDLLPVRRIPQENKHEAQE